LAETPRGGCPQCSSERVVPFGSARGDSSADELTADAAPPAADPPNMRCEACGHRWWQAPHAPKIDPGQEGVAR
jgi:DNA-directed RNA polymerase subunit RPC12/RpoP